MVLGGRPIEAVILDLDGTLFDSIGAYVRAFNRGVAAFGLPPASRRALVGFLTEGVPLEDILRRLYPERAAAEPDFPGRCRQAILEAYLRGERGEQALLPGARQLLEALRAHRLKVGVATGRLTQPEYEWGRFRELGLEALVDALVTPAEVPRRKPAPDVIVECARRLGVSPQRCLVVGDATADVAAARAAGACSVGVLTGVGSAEELRREGADWVVEDLRSLADLLFPEGGAGG